MVSRGVDAIGQNVRVTDLIGQQQNEAGVERFGFGRGQSLMCIQQTFIKTVGIRPLRFSLHVSAPVAFKSAAVTWLRHFGPLWPPAAR